MDEAILSEKKKLLKILSIFGIVLTLFVAVKVVSELRAYPLIGQGVVPTNTITVSGEGEVFAVPDIAEFSFSINITEATVPAAQEKAADIENRVLSYLDDNGVEKKDIRTTNYSVYPRYEYVEIRCITFPCPPGKRELTGHEVNHTISIKVREVDDAGKILSGVGEIGVTNISGLNFIVDDEEEMRREARKKAIENAQEKGRELADDLGVSLGRITSFSESGFYPAFARLDAAVSEGFGGEKAPVPSLPTGENRITSNVTITFEIR